MEMTRETLDSLKELTGRVNTLKFEASEKLRTAQDRSSGATHRMDREGKEIELTERVMWEEVFMIGPACQSGKILRAEHPEVFEAYEEQERAADGLKRFCVAELGVDFTSLTLSDYLTLTESLFRLLDSERKANKRKTKTT